MRILSAMTDDPAGLPIKEYIARGAAEGALAAAQQLSETIGVSLSEILASLQETAPQAAAEHRTGHSSVSGSGAITASGGLALRPMGFGGTAVTKSVAHGDLLGRATEELGVVRRADVERLGKSRFDPTALSLKSRLLLTIVLIAAVYPVLPPEAQKYLLDDVGLAAALAQIFSLLKL